MRLTGKYKSKNTAYFYHISTKKNRVKKLDFEERAELIQDVIDRMTDLTYGKAYHYHLIKVNKKYTIQYEVKNGIRVYGTADISQEMDTSNSVNEDLAMEFDDELQQRKEVVQDVIDRIIDNKHFVKYLNDLEKLHRKYPLYYKTVNGIRVYSKSPVTETPSSLELDQNIYIALSDGTKEISNFNILKEFAQKKVASAKKSKEASEPNKAIDIKEAVENPIIELINFTSSFSCEIYQSFTVKTGINKLKIYLSDKLNVRL